MHGQLFTLFDVAFPSYFVLLLTGFVFATVMGAVWAKRIGQDPDVIVDLGLAMLLCGVAGARILHVLADGYFWDYVHLCTDPAQVAWHISKAECLSQIPSSSVDSWLGCAAEGPRGRWDAAARVCRPLEADCWAWAKFYGGGLAYYGGFVGGSIAAWFLLKVDRFPFWKAADAVGIIVPVGLGFGRMGCLMAGCCFGKPWESPFALSFPGNSPASEWQARHELLPSVFAPSLPVHPTQIYESLFSFAIAFVILFYLHERKKHDGQLFVMFVVAYAAMRFLVEFFRSDDRGDFLGLSTSQWLGLLLIGGALVLNRYLGHRRDLRMGSDLAPAGAKA
jgi:phosphatidylglycerol:prolipoprotein diacylglycerol transferase